MPSQSASRIERVALATGTLDEVKQVQREMRAGHRPTFTRNGRRGAVLTGREYPKRIVRTTGTRQYSLVGYVEWQAKHVA